MHAFNKPVFLVGAMRSGTTLLADLLGESHQIVHCPFELKDIWSAVGGVQMASPKTRDELCHELGTEDVRLGQREKLAAAFIERMSANSSGKASDAVFLNKNPHLCNKLPFVNALFPDARFIWIYRSLPSVVASMYSLFENVNRRQQTWHYWPEPQSETTNRCWQAFHFALPESIDKSRCFPGGDVQYLAEYWLESNRAVADFFSSLPPDRRFIMQEEALIESPVEQIENCLVFLGLSPNVRSGLSESIDTTRNKTWGQQLSEKSLHRLLKIVVDNVLIIGNIFPGKNYAEVYMREIQDAIGSRRVTVKNTEQEMIINPQGKSLVNEYIKRFFKLLSFEKKQSIIPGKQLIIGCVSENSPKYLSQALRLVQSLRWFGGEIADAKFVVCVVGGMDSAYSHEFQKYSAEVRIVERFSKKHPPSNKLRFLQQADLQNYQHVLLLDCDTIIVQDPSPYLQGEGFCAKIADSPTVSSYLFEKLFDFFQLPLPLENYTCTVTGTPTIPYFNAGVLLFSPRDMADLVPAWIKLNEQLIERIELLEDSTNFCEQASLSLALAATGINFDVFGDEMNFPINFDDYITSLDEVDPFIIHYHSLVSPSGYIDSTLYALANNRITQFNDRLRKAREKHFDNKLFWNGRYAVNPDLGSGIGSRGVHRNYKRALLKNITDSSQFETILDIGCGDMEIGSILPSSGYTGIDVSSVVIDRNREVYPDRTFLCGDFLALSFSAADLLVCMDVLIHISDYRYYKKFVAKLVKKTLRIGVVAGYESDPGCGGIIFYHEPLSETLHWAGAKRLCRLGSSRGTDIWMFKML